MPAAQYSRAAPHQSQHFAYAFDIYLKRVLNGCAVEGKSTGYQEARARRLIMKDSVIKFFEFVRQDEKLAERLRALGDKIEEFSRLACELGREHGFVFEPKDVQETLNSLVSQNQGELTDEQLGAIAAGGSLCSATVLKLTVACVGVAGYNVATAGCPGGTAVGCTIGCG